MIPKTKLKKKKKKVEPKKKSKGEPKKVKRFGISRFKAIDAFSNNRSTDKEQNDEETNHKTESADNGEENKANKDNNEAHSPDTKGKESGE